MEIKRGMCPSKVCIFNEIRFWWFQFDNIIISLIFIQQCYWIRCKRKWHPATPSFNDCISFSIGDLPTINKVPCLIVEIEASLFDCFHAYKVHFKLSHSLSYKKSGQITHSRRKMGVWGLILLSCKMNWQFAFRYIIYCALKIAFLPEEGLA